MWTFFFFLRHELENLHGWTVVSLPTKIWICNYIFLKQRTVITRPWPKFNGGLVKPPLKLGHKWLITSHIKQWRWLRIHALTSFKSCMLVKRSFRLQELNKCWSNIDRAANQQCTIYTIKIAHGFCPVLFCFGCIQSSRYDNTIYSSGSLQ